MLIAQILIRQHAPPAQPQFHLGRQRALRGALERRQRRQLGGPGAGRWVAAGSLTGRHKHGRRGRVRLLGSHLGAAVRTVSSVWACVAELKEREAPRLCMALYAVQQRPCVYKWRQFWEM